MSENPIQDSAAPQNPKEQGPQPDHPQQKIAYPGSTADMHQKPDHGEESYEGLGRLTNKVALITGGDSGIGKAVAIAFARDGSDVVLSYLPDEEQDASDTASWIEKAGHRAVKLPGDLQEEAQCNNIVVRTFEEFGKLDLLVNVAAFQMAHEKIERPRKIQSVNGP
jgi:hypothetical protein